jgi:hypothetical protein
VAAQLGYCGLDRQRRPLTGEEIRPCWEAADATGAAIPSLPGVGPVWPVAPDEDRTGVRPLEFVEVPSNAVRAVTTSPDESAAAEPATGANFVTSAGGEPRWILWGEPEA